MTLYDSFWLVAILTGISVFGLLMAYRFGCRIVVYRLTDEQIADLEEKERR
jgi:hypothetical protein